MLVFLLVLLKVSSALSLSPVHNSVGCRRSLVNQQPAHGGGAGHSGDHPEDGVGQPEVHAVHFFGWGVACAQAQHNTHLKLQNTEMSITLEF